PPPSNADYPRLHYPRQAAPRPIPLPHWPKHPLYQMASLSHLHSNTPRVPLPPDMLLERPPMHFQTPSDRHFHHLPEPNRPLPHSKSARRKSVAPVPIMRV